MGAGGVAIWVKDSVEVGIIDLQDFCIENDVEICGISYLGHYIFCIYRAPKSNFNVFLEAVEHILDIHYNAKNKLILAGDLNVDYLVNSGERTLLNSLMSTYDLFQIVKEPTRVTFHSETILDHVFVKSDSTSEVDVVDSYLSDHRMLMFRLPLIGHNTDEVFVFRRVTNRYNLARFRDILAKEAWGAVYEGLSFDDKFDKFYGIFLYHFLNCFPLKKVKQSVSSWVNAEVKISSQKLKDLFSLKIKYPELLPLYNQAKKDHNALVSRTKKQFYCSRFKNSENANKTAWNIINQLTNSARKSFQKITLIKDGTRVTDSSEVADAFNDFFLDSLKDLTAGVSSVGLGKPDGLVAVPFTMAVIPFDENEIFDIIRGLKNRNSSGRDEVPVKVVKEAASSIVSPLTFLINESIESGIFPNALKCCRSVPLHKKGQRTALQNYRQITICSVFHKIFERAMLSRLSNYLAAFNVIGEGQHGFRSGYSTTTALIEVYKRIIESVNGGDCPVGVFCDLSRAFDTVDHGLLLSKLDNYGIRGVVLEWFESYLSDRSQYIEVSDICRGSRVARCSRVRTLGCGVPQGSILGPILFILYVNDLAQLDGVTMYADDACLTVTGHGAAGVETGANLSLKMLSRGFSRSGLLLNCSKTSYLRFHAGGRGLPLLDLRANGELLRGASSVRFLGVDLQDDLRWDLHCAGLIGKLNTACYQIRNLRGILDESDVIRFYYAQVFSRLACGMVLWGASPAASQVFVSQKRILRCIASVPRMHSCRPLFKKYNIMTLPCIYIYEVLLFTHKRRHLFINNHDIHTYATRRNLVRLPLPRLELYKSSPFYNGIRLYNVLPDEVLTRNVGQFGVALKRFLLLNAFYSVEEFLLHPKLAL